MKVFFFAVIALAITACSGKSELEIGDKTTMEVARVYDAGEVVRGELIRAKFVVKNTGDSPLAIGSVNAGCSCTVTDSPKDPILPGKSGVIIATVDTDRTGLGKMDKSVTFTANTKPNTVELKIKATVVDK